MARNKKRNRNQGKQKNLLSERHVRRFMQLANNDAFSQKFLTERGMYARDYEEEMYENEELEERKTPEQQRHTNDLDETLREMPEDEEEDLGMGGEEELGSGVEGAPELGDEEMPPEELEMGDEGGAVESDVEELVSAIADAITSTTGVEVDVQSDVGDDGGMDDLEDVGGEEDLGGDMEPEMGGGMGDEEEMPEEPLSEALQALFEDDSKLEEEDETLEEREAAKAPKVTKQPQGHRPQPGGKVEQPLGSVPAPTKIPTGGDPATNKMKTLEEELTKRVLRRLVNEMKKVKAKKQKK